jgi:murein DD-endopeptidase MepM/ murein hydrolase activator NlpD
MRSMKIFLAVLFLALASTGCVTAPKKIAPLPVAKTSVAASYHKVVKGQTLWRIARLYGMDVDELASFNSIQDSSKLEVGQQLIIPSGRKIQAVLPDSSDEDFSWPVRGRVVSGFNQMAHNAVNKGINIEPGRSPDVLASRSGVVAFFNEDFLDLGRTIILEHPEGFWTVYGRNQEVYVKPGDVVSKGMAIAKVGRAGRDKNVYLHFEIRKGSKSENPLFYLP